MLESVPNFSEGRDADVIEALRAALSAPARLLDVHVDADHHRSVFTLVGEPRRARRDAARGDRVRTGAHRPAPARGRAPADRRRGRGSDRPDPKRRPGACPRDGARHWRGGSGRSWSSRSSSTASWRRAAGPRSSGAAGLQELQQRIDAGELAPDFGPARLDERAGGVIVGARQAADRVQRQPARLARGGASGRLGRAGDRRRLSRACARSGSSSRARASSRCR